jgi:hypothetical protein
LRHCATSWKVAGSIPDELIGFVVELVLLAALWLWGALSLQEKGVLGVYSGRRG